jgi:hypothetical protein
MKQKLKWFFTTVLLSSSIVSLTYACQPWYSHLTDDQQGCPGLYK